MSFRSNFCLAVLLASGFVLGALPARAADTATEAVTAAVNDPGRPPDDIARDPAQNPDAVLSFAQINPGSIAVDLIPGDGYYTRMLSPLIGPSGKLYAFVPLPQVAEGMRQRREEAAAIQKGKVPLVNNVDVALSVQNVSEYRNVTVFWEPLGQYGGQFALPEQLDDVFTAGGYHQLHGDVYKSVDMSAVNKAIFRAMKSGGLYTVSDNAAAKGAGFGVADSLGRSDEDAVKAEILAAGFVLDGESTALANSSDNHTMSADDARMRDKADRYLLRFKKPEDAVTPNKRPPTDFMDNYYGNTYVYNVGSKTERHHFYHPDGTYQEVGRNDKQMQSGTDFWDVDGHNCQLHQDPVWQRGFIVCHGFTIKNVGDVGTQDNGNGDGPKPATILKGIVYPEGIN